MVKVIVVRSEIKFNLGDYSFVHHHVELNCDVPLDGDVPSLVEDLLSQANLELKKAVESSKVDYDELRGKAF